MTVSPYQNSSSASTDLYLTITRRGSARDGWLAVGLGPAMTGALMFIIYAEDAQNPDSGMKTSVRTAVGHSQPSELSAMDFDQDSTIPEVRVIKSAYEDDLSFDSAPASDVGAKPKTGTAHIVIYSPDLWPRTNIDPTSPSQPWIWAHNPNSQITSSSSAAITGDTIQMHQPTVDSGFGFFWTDFHSALSRSASSLPPSFHHPFDPTKSYLSTTNPPPIYRLGGPQIRNWMFHLHGLLGCLASLVLYPLGALLLRTSDSRAFNFHWTTQSFASVLLVLGAMLGWTLSRRIELVHQVLGLIVTACVALQVLLGWRHHVAFLRRRMGTWMGKAHVWIGREILVAGWVNVLLGLKARGYGALTLAVVVLVVLAEGAVMLRILGYRKTIPRLLFFPGSGPGGPKEGMNAAVGGGEAGLDEEYFELVENDEDYDEDGRLRADVEWEERTRGKGEDQHGDHDQARKLKRLDIV